MLKELDIGAKVYSADHQFLGRLVYLVISQKTGKLVKIVLKRGVFDNQQKVVDIQEVCKIYEDGRAVDLILRSKKFADCPFLTIYEETKSYPASPEAAYPLKYHTRLVTYLPDSVFSKEEGADNEAKLTDQFMRRVQIYSDEFILLGGKSLFSFGDNKENGTIHKITFELSDGRIKSIILRQGLPFFPISEFQVPFKLNALNRLDKSSALQFS